MGIITDVASMSAALPVNSLPCIAPQSSNWEVYSSTYYQGDPTAHPTQWTGPESPDGDGPLNADWTDMPNRNYFICRCKTSAGWSPWSNIIPGSLNVSVSQQTESLEFRWNGTNPEEWTLAIYYDEGNWSSASASSYEDQEDDDVTITPTARSFDVSGRSTPFYFILVANSLINGVDVEAARGEYTTT